MFRNMKHTQYESTLTFLHDGTISEGISNDAKKFSRIWLSHILKRRVEFSFRRREQWGLVRKSETESVTESALCGLSGAHVGRNHNVDAVFNKYFWPGLSKEFERFVRSCMPCQKDRGLNLQGPKLIPIPVSTRIFDRWGLDLAGPF